MSTPEKKVKDNVRKVLDDMKCYYFFPATHGYGRSGVPDIVGCYKGFFFAIECKAGKNQPTALQQREMRKIMEAGGATFLANEETTEELQAWLRTLL